MKQNQDIFINKSQTGNIGTALYVAPEINILGPKAIYNEVSIDCIFFFQWVLNIPKYAPQYETLKVNILKCFS